MSSSDPHSLGWAPRERQVARSGETSHPNDASLAKSLGNLMRYPSNRQIGHTITAPSTAVTVAASHPARPLFSSSSLRGRRRAQQLVDDSGVRDGVELRVAWPPPPPTARLGHDRPGGRCHPQPSGRCWATGRPYCILDLPPEEVGFRTKRGCRLRRPRGSSRCRRGVLGRCPDA